MHVQTYAGRLYADPNAPKDLLREIDDLLPVLYLSAWLSPVIPIGVFLGRWLNRKMSDRIFYHVSHVVLFAMSAKLIYDVL